VVQPGASAAGAAAGAELLSAWPLPDCMYKLVMPSTLRSRYRNFPGIPRSLRKILETDEARKAIRKGLEQLGER
jgi:hypothetical protein